MTPLVAPEIERYVRDLLPPRDPVIAEMERQAEQRNIPIVGPAVATLLATLAQSIGARRVFEMGSAIGYSTAFFARAVRAEGRVFYTDGSADNAKEASGYLSRLKLLDRVEVRTGDAVSLFQKTPGEFDVIFIDIDKDGYPQALEAAAPRGRRGGVLLGGKGLWFGAVGAARARGA